jgi:Mycothiol maleylpyruvate isomerase N-terminal domain.
MTKVQPFIAEDFAAVSTLALDAWRAGLDRDWSVPAGTLKWSCFETADHTINCAFSYAFFLASRAQTAYPPFGEVDALPEATPADLVDGLRAMTNLLYAIIVAAPPETQAIISRHPTPRTGSPNDFAARGAHELILHAYDISCGLGVPFDPPRETCQRLMDHTAAWPFGEVVRTDDPWSDLLRRSGR